jgi:hypothetical protein
VPRHKSKYGRAVTGGRHHTVWNNREKALRGLKKKFGNTRSAYAIANAGHTKAGRKKMAKKAAATRKAKGRGGKRRR